MPTIITQHELKIETAYYHQVVNGNKPFEIRFNDRAFQKSDIVFLKAFEKGNYRTDLPPIKATISYVTNYAQREGWCVFGLCNVEVLERKPDERD